MRRYEIVDDTPMAFVASVTKINPAQFTTMVDRLEEYGAVKRGLEQIMFCPLTASDGTLSIIEYLSNHYDIHVSCDSGGYESQINEEYSMRDIYRFDREFYRKKDWPDEYVLPDQVPIASDDDGDVEHKVQDTISLARMLYNDLSPSKQEKTIPVVQGHTKQQIVDCLDAYTGFKNISKIGFGSFSTGGVNGGVNYLTESNIELLQFVVKEAQKHNLDVHAFGVGGPTSIPILYQCGIDTFDSTGWMRSGGYGNVFFPFKSRFNITHRRDRSGPDVYKKEFRELKVETDHECPYCESFDQLQENRMSRILHNLIVMREMTEMVEYYSISDLLDIMNPRSKYTKYLEKIRAA